MSSYCSLPPWVLYSCLQNNLELQFSLWKAHSKRSKNFVIPCNVFKKTLNILGNLLGVKNLHTLWLAVANVYRCMCTLKNIHWLHKTLLFPWSSHDPEKTCCNRRTTYSPKNLLKCNNKSFVLHYMYMMILISVSQRFCSIKTS